MRPASCPRPPRPPASTAPPQVPSLVILLAIQGRLETRGRPKLPWRCVELDAEAGEESVAKVRFRRDEQLRRHAPLRYLQPPPLAYESNSLDVRQDLAAVRGLLPLVHAFLDVPWEVSRRQASLVDDATGGAFWEGPIRSPPQDPNADDRRSTRPTAQSEAAPRRSVTSFPTPTSQARLGPIGTIPQVGSDGWTLG